MTRPSPIDSPQTLSDWLFPWPAFDVDWTQSALVIIDFQNYSANPQAGLVKMLREQKPSLAAYYVPRITEVAIPNTVRLAEAFRRAGRQLVYTRHGALLPDGRDMIERRRRRDRDALSCTAAPAMWSKGSFEHQVIDALQPQPDDLVIDKNTSSPFNGTGIEHLLRNMNIQTLVVTGVATDMCVETTSRDAADRGFNVIVVEDAVATFVEKHHVAALSALARVFTQVWPTDRVLKQLEAAPPSLQPEAVGFQA
jgi:nicotinamidase-related amidase